ncbi:hypothetical protein Pla22_12700 [Rubripirellula amarantea]|uniref:Uncharacterized protein n=1 Tax=Rubripirellula amarantea TaxID=2527999 RepID=A0A5C5WT23_9BACT|nr:hypothetical protein [Rubripirellula amarantea]TWT53640.1 hypothetical protein Pla22_12700 [Rubripirellula amarantea]
MSKHELERRGRILALDKEWGKEIVVDDPKGWLSTQRPWLGITSSRLGHDGELHQRVCRFLSRCILDARSRNAVLVIAKGSAIESWATRAAELWGADLIRVCCEAKCVCVSSDAQARTLDFSGCCDAEVHLGLRKPGDLNRDQCLIGVVDRLDAVYVRTGGTIAASIEERLRASRNGDVRVVISGEGKCAGAGLLAAGAVGWYSPNGTQPDRSESLGSNRAASQGANLVVKGTLEPWADTVGEWLIHCTRGRRGPWPDETESQYRDQVILGTAEAIRRGPLDALIRILRTGRLTASAVTSAKLYPVVCFTAVSLNEILSRRCFRSHLSRWDYEPYGIAIRMNAALALGMEPVIYGRAPERKLIAEHDRYRFHPIGNSQVWRQEKEWRSRETIELNDLDVKDVRVFVRDSEEARRRLTNVPFAITWIDQVANPADINPPVAKPST